MSDVSDTIRAFYRAYRSRDRTAAEALMHPDSTFTSPYDDAIDKVEYFARCWAPGIHQTEFVEERLVEEGNGGFLTYFVTTDAGLSFRNTEYLTVKRGCVTSVTVYFGASYRDGKFVKKEPE
jgi:ketosteroid isomerase-like protein